MALRRVALAAHHRHPMGRSATKQSLDAFVEQLGESETVVPNVPLLVVVLSPVWAAPELAAKERVVDPVSAELTRQWLPVEVRTESRERCRPHICDDVDLV